jgi:hypothetical protein
MNPKKLKRAVVKEELVAICGDIQQKNLIVF